MTSQYRRSPGARGGATLARDPERISLLDVYRAVEEGGELFSLHPSEPSRSCSVGCNIVDVLRPVFGRAHQAMEAVLGEVSIADVCEDLHQRSGGACGLAPAEVTARTGTARR